MVKRDYYEILGVDRNADADTLKKAYRRLARQLHPDVNPGDPEAESRFKELGEAYQALNDPQKRAVYDQFGHDGLNGGGFGGGGGFGFEDFGFGDIFDAFFGRSTRARRPGPRRGADLRYQLDITFEQAAKGFDKDIEIPTLLACDTCEGTGSTSGKKPEACKRCGGTGEMRTTRQTIFGTMINTSACPSCGGAGRAVPDPCRRCNGSGRAEGTKTVRITIPAGVDTGQKLRLSNEGVPGETGAPPGDLYVIINLLPHTFFQRDGQDVVCEVPISFTQAALGAEFEVPTLYGPEKLRIPPGTQTATVFRLREKGFPHLRGYHKGDQHVFVRVQVPTKLNAKQKTLLDEFAKLGGEDTSAPQAGLFSKLKDIFMN